MAFPKDIASYCQYMEQIAIDNKELEHRANSTEGQTEAYGEVWMSSDPMSGIDWRSFFNQMKNKIKYPCLINLGVSFDSNGDAGNVQQADAKFAILIKMGKGDLSTERKLCYATAERIARQILTRNRYYFDSNLEHGWMEDKATTEPIGPINVDGPLYGVVVNFDYYVRDADCYVPEDWATEITIEE